MIALANLSGTITDSNINGIVLLHLALVTLPCIFSNKVSDWFNLSLNYLKFTGVGQSNLIPYF